LLGRFVAVCNAVAYAHSRGILHRDLKPGNVILGPYGETLVVDWGLAKPIARNDTLRATGEPTLAHASASDAGATQTGEALGTPSYMSPEQASGQWGQVGPASDIYSLGSILYTLLTGRLPVAAGGIQEKIEKVKRGDFPRPATVKPCPPALEAVCLKAMALRPEERYPTALPLAADVEHGLADKPVGAWPEPWTMRALRRVKRHPGWVTGSVAAVLLAAVVTGAIGLVQPARERENQARADAKLTAFKARQESERARENYGLALNTSDKLVDLAQSLKNLPGTRIGSLRHLLTLADKNFGRMLSRAQGEAPLLARTGRVLNALSELYIDLGDTRKALERGRQARALFEGLLKEDPGNAAWQQGLAVSLDRIGVALWWQGDASRALDSARRALALYHKVSPPDSDKLQWQAEQAMILTRIGNMLADQRDESGALKGYQESFTIAKARVRRHPKNRRARHRLGIALGKISGSLHWRKRRDLRGALAHYEKAVAIYRDLIRDDPDNTEWRLNLGWALGYVGDVWLELGEVARARKAYEEALVFQPG
jgi:tetratricopeptide (TPR) repeat protein